MKLLTTRGIHYAVTRFGPRKLRAMAFDAKYNRGDWRFHADNQGELSETIKRYMREGDLLVLGCGGASVLDGLEADGLKSVLGIDLSREALRLASRYATRKVRFQVADMETFECPQSYDQMLFSESLNYVRASRQIQVLRRLSMNLKAGGVFVVTLSDATRYLDTLERIRANFRVLEDRSFTNSTRHLLVFQPR